VEIISSKSFVSPGAADSTTWMSMSLFSLARFCFCVSLHELFFYEKSCFSAVGACCCFRTCSAGSS